MRQLCAALFSTNTGTTTSAALVRAHTYAPLCAALFSPYPEDIPPPPFFNTFVKIPIGNVAEGYLQLANDSHSSALSGTPVLRLLDCLDPAKQPPCLALGY